MEFARKHLGTIISLLVFLLIAAVVGRWIQQSRTSPFVPRSDNTLRRHIYDDPDYLNPILRTDVNGWYVMRYCHHDLIAWDYAKDDYKPMLATKWVISPDGLDYTLSLRTDVRWHDDAPFDADDVMFSFKDSMDPDLPVGHARSGYMDMVVRECIPAGDGNGEIAATEYLTLKLDALPALSGEPRWDGATIAEASVVAEATGGALRAARFGDRLYLSAPAVARHDTVIFVAREPGAPKSYGPSTHVAAWEALFVSDDGNTQPSRTKWLSEQSDRIKSASFAVGASDVECMVDLRELFALESGDVLPATVGVVAAIVDDVQLEKLDRYTIKFHFPQKVFSNLDWAGGLRLIPKHIYDDGIKLTEHPKRDNLIGVGPYKFVRWEHNKEIVVERWDKYWGATKPKIQRIEFKVINDQVVAYQVFKKGDIDAMAVGTWTYSMKSKGKDFDQHFYKLVFDKPGYSYVGWNCRRSFFSDYRCRQAMSHLFDLPSVCKNVLLGIYRPVTGPFYYKEPANDPEPPVYDYNIAEASRLLGEAGWIDHDGDGIRDKDLDGDGTISAEPLNNKDGKKDDNLREKFSFDFLVVGGPDVAYNWVMLSLMRNCSKLGIQCQPRAVEWALFLEWTRQSKFDASVSGWDNSYESDPYDNFHSSQIADGFNRIGFSDPAVDKMIETARQELDKPKRSLLFRGIHRALYKLQPYTFLIGSSNPWVLNKRVEDATAYNLGFDFTEWRLQGHENGN